MLPILLIITLIKHGNIGIYHTHSKCCGDWLKINELKSIISISNSIIKFCKNYELSHKTPPLDHKHHHMRRDNNLMFSD